MVIGHDGCVVLSKRVTNRGLYSVFPGGVEEGASPEKAAVRAAREDLGRDVRTTRLVAVVTYHERDQG